MFWVSSKREVEFHHWEALELGFKLVDASPTKFIFSLIVTPIMGN